MPTQFQNPNQTRRLKTAMCHTEYMCCVLERQTQRCMYVWQAQVGERKKMEGSCIYLSGVGNKQLTTMTTFSAAASKCSECDVIAGLGEFGHLLRRISRGSSRVGSTYNWSTTITLLVSCNHHCVRWEYHRGTHEQRNKAKWRIVEGADRSWSIMPGRVQSCRE